MKSRTGGSLTPQPMVEVFFDTTQVTACTPMGNVAVRANEVYATVPYADPGQRRIGVVDQTHQALLSALGAGLSRCVHDEPPGSRPWIGSRQWHHRTAADGSKGPPFRAGASSCGRRVPPRHPGSDLQHAAHRVRMSTTRSYSIRAIFGAGPVARHEPAPTPRRAES